MVARRVRTLAAWGAAIVASAAVSSAVAQPAQKKGPRPDAAALEKAILDAPGPVGCWTNNTGDVIKDCEQREKGLSALKTLYAADRTRALAAIQKRFDEIPSPKGGYFPILAAVQVKDKALLVPLKKLAKEQKDNALGTYANEAIRILETGKCSQTPPPARLRELCM